MISLKFHFSIKSALLIAVIRLVQLVNALPVISPFLASAIRVRNSRLKDDFEPKSGAYCGSYGGYGGGYGAYGGYGSYGGYGGVYGGFGSGYGGYGGYSGYGGYGYYAQGLGFGYGQFPFQNPLYTMSSCCCNNGCNQGTNTCGNGSGTEVQKKRKKYKKLRSASISRAKKKSKAG